MSTGATEWHPIAASHDLPLRHVFHAQLLGNEYALWRADDGNVNLWDNRCLHRGVRLSIGINDGHELKCQYHGWRYANRTGGCTYIPAHPANAPARTIYIQTFSTVEKYGMIWARETEGTVAPAPAFPWIDESGCLVLRPLPVNAGAETVLQRLKGYRFIPSARLASGEDADEARVRIAGETAHSLLLESTADGDTEALTFFVQPVGEQRCVIRGVLDKGVPGTRRLVALRHHNLKLSALRLHIESASPPPPADVPAECDKAFPLREPARNEAFQAQQVTTEGRALVHRKWRETEDIVGLELTALRGHLPSAQPGSHIDVHLPNGLVRQYSLVNGPGETAHYVIGVKRETESRGGSAAIHDVLREGDVVAISQPRNNFPLRRDADHTLLIAGGIGITPIAAMAQALQVHGSHYALHYFARSEDQLAFAERLRKEHFTPHLGQDAHRTTETLRDLLKAYKKGRQVYACGPGPMLELTRRLAADAGWPEDAVHFEYFANSNVIDDSHAFDVLLARSNLTLAVPAGKTILEVLRENGVQIASSCEQGACGTCMATVLEGEILHQDAYLNNGERQAGNKILTCVSRAKGARLVLDI